MDLFGQHFIVAYDGLAMTSDLKEFCRRFAIGGRDTFFPIITQIQSS